SSTSVYLLFTPYCCIHPALHSFPTRRSSDLIQFIGLPGVRPSRKRLDSDNGDVPNVQIADLRVTHGRVKRALRPNAGSVVCNDRSEEHTSELQSRFDLVCRLLLEKKKQ